MSKYVNLKNTVILLFIAYYLSSVISLQLYDEFHDKLGLKKSLKESVDDVFDFVRYPLKVGGIYRMWGYFSSPPKSELHVLIRGDSAGDSVYYSPEFQTLSFKRIHEKSRKFHSRINRGYSDIRNTYLKSFCNRFENEYGREFNNITFRSYKKQIPKLTSVDPTEKKQLKEYVVKC